MKSSKVGLIGLAAGFIILAGAYVFAGCGKHPDGAGWINGRVMTDDKHGNHSYYIYVTEYEPDENGETVIKCYELTEEQYNNYQYGDEYIPGEVIK